ncbi:MAG: PilZ domain-containing protein [Candidatus Omnitrophica bacterium]|nr:PilZ domain-containing protein [Candidatus Omnitrophota bacterium]
MDRKRGKFERLDTTIPVEVFLRGGGGESYSVMCENIGGKGLRFPLHKAIEANTRLELIIHLPDNLPPLRTQGKVSWAKAKKMADGEVAFFEMGVEFLELKFQDRDRIHQYVYRRAQQGGPTGQP